MALLERAEIPFDLVAVLPRHLKHVDYLSDRFPGLTVVIDHLAKPPIGTDRRQPWRDLMARAARNPRVVAEVVWDRTARAVVRGRRGRPAAMDR